MTEMRLPLDCSVLDAEYVRGYADALHLELPHLEQMSFLQSISSVDVQAAPGCGKTTLAALKLCILGSGWRSDRQGICVLSHTNVAKDLIREILERDRNGGRLLSYPHFVGTIQGFVDSFLAVPYLHSRGIDVRSVDDEFYERYAQRSLGKNKAYATLSAYLARKPNGSACVTKSVYRYRDGELEVCAEAGAESGALPGRDTESYKQLCALKEALCRAGIFRFSDMFALGAQLMHAHPALLDALRWRFPFCLIDEMQDTSPIQETVLGRIFDAEVSVIQRIGDINQRIFRDDAADEEALGDTVFPKTSAMQLPKSLRFGPSIANVATKLTTRSPQEILGSASAPDEAPTLFLFDEKTVANVLEAFAKEVKLRVPSDRRSGRLVKAIGARKSSNSKVFPKTIGTYFAAYEPPTSHLARPQSLFSAAIRAQASVAGEEATATGADLLWQSVCEILRLWSFKANGRIVTRRRLQQFLDANGTSHTQSFRQTMLAVLQCDLETEHAWIQCSQELADVIQRECALADPPNNVIDYMSFGMLVPDVGTAGTAVSHSPSFFSGNDEVVITLDTIHNSKGETHAATLVLECCDRRGKGHDLAEVLPVLVGKGDPKRIGSVTVADCLRTSFVGMTRPQALLCLAVLKDHALRYLVDLADAGWKVIDLTDVSTNTNR
jgi:hypothetical protein